MPRGDHFYTTSLPERDNAIKSLGYVDEGTVGYVFESPISDASRTPLFRLYAKWNGDHFYTTSDQERVSAMSEGYSYEGVPCHIWKSSSDNRIPLFRLYAQWNGDHFYTTNPSERDSAVAGNYKYEGITGYVYKSKSADDLVPLYRAYAQGNGDHFYTTDKAEFDKAVAGMYVSEDIACYVAKAANSRSPLYRLFNPSTGDHCYTISTDERQLLTSAGYQDEGIQAYVLSSQSSSTIPLFRAFAPWNGDHFYTQDQAEHQSALSDGYLDRGIACYVHSSNVPGSTPLYRTYRQFDSNVLINLILVGHENFNATEEGDIFAAADYAAAIFAKIGIKIETGNTLWKISTSDAEDSLVVGGYFDAVALSEDWTVANEGVDVFIVRSLHAAGYSPANGPCNKNQPCVMTGYFVHFSSPADVGFVGNTIAHELGHYLGLYLHPKSPPDNFLLSNSGSNTGIEEHQGTKMKKHCAVRFF